MKSKLLRWKEDPRLFVRECIGATPDDWQDDVLASFNTNPRIAMKAAKGPGKSTVLAWLVWLFLATRVDPKVPCTSISGDNLRDGLWAELAKWQNAAPILRHQFTWTAERIFLKARPETWWAAARQWSKTADSNQQANTLAGLHSKHLLFVIDEAGGVPDAVSSAAEGGLSTGGDTHLLLSGNPTHLSGPLYRACTRERQLWKIFEVTGDPDDPKRSKRISIQWAREQIEKYGRDNPWVLINVFAQFPPQQSNALIGVDEVDGAASRSIADIEWMHAYKLLGVDVARFGDDKSVIATRQGYVAHRMKEFRNLNSVQLAGHVALAIDTWQPDSVFVDQTGVGAGVVDQLREMGHDVIGIDNAQSALRAEPKLANRRAECWWLMAEWLKRGCIPDDAELRAELPGPSYRFDKYGRIVLESKEDMKKRGLPSPNKADALALTFALPTPLTSPRAAMDPYAAPDPRALSNPRRAQRVETEFNPFADGDLA
jgi:phage terminase large subunit